MSGRLTNVEGKTASGAAVGGRSSTSLAHEEYARTLVGSQLSKCIHSSTLEHTSARAAPHPTSGRRARAKKRYRTTVKKVSLVARTSEAPLRVSRARVAATFAMGDGAPATRRSKRHRPSAVDESEPTQSDMAAPATASGDAKALEEARSLIVTLREKEAQQDRNLKVMDRNLMIMQRHLSEERARVAELHGRLLGRSAVGDRAEVREEVAVRVRSGEGPPPECPAHAAKADATKAEPPRGCPMHAHAGDKRPAPEDEQQEAVRGKLRQESFKEEPMALSSLKELAMDSVLEGVTIADFSLPDQPLIYANHGFEEITGYSIEETVGHNCRFLQGPNTEPEKLMHIRKCISAGLPCTVQLKNYRKTDRPQQKITRNMQIQQSQQTGSELLHVKQAGASAH